MLHLYSVCNRTLDVLFDGQDGTFDGAWDGAALGPGVGIDEGEKQQ